MEKNVKKILSMAIIILLLLLNLLLLGATDVPNGLMSNN